MNEELDSLYDQFEKAGGCGHDLELSALCALLVEWEKIRSPSLIEKITTQTVNGG